jgi:hypothetical protein
MMRAGEDQLVDIGNFATAVKAKQGATTNLDRATIQTLFQN